LSIATLVNSGRNQFISKFNGLVFANNKAMNGMIFARLDIKITRLNNKSQFLVTFSPMGNG
jgi:hypothetical protein